MIRNPYCTVAQMRAAIESLRPDDELLVNAVANLSVLRRSEDGEWAQVAHIELAAFGEPEAELVEGVP